MCLLRVYVCMCLFSTHSPYLFKPDRLNQHGEKRFIIIFIKMYRFSYEQHNNNSSGTKQPTPDSCMWICCEPTLWFFFSLLLALGLMFTIFSPIAMVLLMLHDIFIKTTPPKLYRYAIPSTLFGFTQKPEQTFFSFCYKR